MVAWAIIAAVISVVASAGVYYQQKKMEAQAQKQANEAKAVQVSGHDSNRGLYTVYGQTLVGSTVVWKAVTDKEARITQSGFTTISAATGSHLTTNKDHKNNRWLYRAVTLCNGPVTEITNVTIDDEGYRSPRFTNKTNKHFATTYSVGPTAGQNFSALRNAYASDFSTWASDAVGKGVAYAIERLYLHKDKPAYQGEPQTRYRVKGRALYDPRKDSTSSAYDSNLGTSSHRADTATTWEYSDNPVLALLDYMRSGEYGRGLDLSVIDIDSIAVSADKCDVLVDIPQRLANDTGSVVTYYDPETGEVYVVTVNGDYPYYRADQQTTGVNANKQRRFRINMAVDPSKEILDNIQEILNVFRGNLSYANGKYFVHMADVASPVLTLNDDDIIGGLKIANGDRSQRMNRATVKFINQAKQYKTDQVSWPSLDSNEDGGLYATYLTQDEDEKLHRTFTIKGCTDFYQAQDTAEFLVRDSRSNLSVSGTFGSRCFGLIPGDVVALDYDSSGFSGKYFRVIQTQVDLVSMNVGLQLKEYDSSVYTWNTSRGNEPLGLSWQEEVVNADPTNLTIGTIATNTTTRSDGSASQTLTIPFSDVPEAAQYVEIGVATNNTTEYETHLVFDTENQTQAEIPIARDNQTYAVRARYFATNSYGTLMPSAYTETTHAVASLSGTKLDGIATGATQNTGALADLDTVDTAQIDNDAITVAKLDTSLESTNYQAGVSGWKLTKAGVFEAGSGTFRGAVTATSITLDGVTIPSSDLDQSTQDSLGLADSAIQDTDTGLDLGITAGSVGGITINSTSVESTNFSAGVSGFKLASNGSLEVGDGTFRGSITATSLSLASTVAIGGDNLPIDIYAGIDSTTINKDPYFTNRNGDYWFANSVQTGNIDADSEFTYKNNGTGLPTGRTTYLQAVSNDDSADQFHSEDFDFDSDKVYRVTVWVRQPSGVKTNYLLVNFKDSSGTNIGNSSTPVSDATGWGSLGTYHYFGAINTAFPTTYTKYEVVFGGNSSVKAPSNAAEFSVGALTLRSPAGSTTTVNWAQYHVEEIDTAATNASVTSIGGVTITSNSLYQGTGAFNTSNTGFYLDSAGQFSLKDKLSFDGTDLTLDGDITARDLNITNATVTGTLSANNLAIDGVTLDTNSSGEIIIKDGGVSNDQIGASSVAASNIIEGSVSKINPVTQTQNVYRWAGYDDAGNVVNAVPSGITVEYDTTEKALELRNDGNVGMRSDTFVIDQNSIYKITAQFKKDVAVGNYYLGAYQKASFGRGQTQDGGNAQGQVAFTVYDATRASSSASNAYFFSSSATTSYVEKTAYLIGSNVNINEVPDTDATILQAADGYENVAIRILNWSNSGTTTSLFVKHLSVVEMTATTIIAENISTTNLAAINSNLGAIDAGSLDIGGGNFTVSTAGAMTATGATISGAITATSLSLNAAVNIGSGNLDSTVVSGAAAGATANQDSTATILGGNHTGTVNNVSASTVTSGAAAGATALQIADISEIISEGNIPTGKLTLNSAGNKTVVFSGNSLTSSGGTDNTWDTHVYSSEHYDSPLVLQFEIGTTGLRYMVGLNEDPTANTSYSSIDYAFYQNVNTFTIYESGSQAVPDGGAFTYAAGDKLSIVYDGTNIYYYHNDTLKRTVSNVGAKDFYFDSSLYDSNQMSINDIRLAPISNIDYGSIGGITIEPNRLYQGTGAWANSNTGFYLDSAGKFSLKDKLFFNPANNTLTVDGNITADIITAKQNLVVLGDLQASSVATGSITRAMLSQDALDEIFGSLASSVGGSNGDFKEGSGTFTTSGGSVTLGTSSDKFDHGVSDVDVEFNINTFFYTTTNYTQAQAQATLTFEATANGSFNDLNSADKTHTLQFLEYDLSSYYGYTYLVYHINTAITKTFTSGSGSDLTDNVDVQFRVAVSGVGSAFTGQTIPFDVAANEGVTGVTSTGGNADTLDNLDSTAFLRSNTNDTFDGDLTITGQLILNGSIDQYNVTDLDVSDKTITVNSGNTQSLSDGAGLIVDRGTAAAASILWNETDGAFDISHSITIEQPSPYIVLKDTTDNDDQKIIFKNNTDGVDYEIATQNVTSSDAFTFYSASQEIVSRIGSNNIFEAHSNVVKSLKPLEVTGTVTWTGGSSTNANTAYGWGDHASGGYSDEYKNYAVASGADHDTHHWNKTHAAYSNAGSSPSYIVLTTNVPQDNYSMGGFTLVFQNEYNNSGNDEGDTITIYGYWNPETNGGFIGFRYHTSNPDCAPTIQVGRNTSGKTVFLISNEPGNYAQVVAKDLWLGYAASSAASSWGDSWAFSEASTTGNISNLNTLNRVGITAAQRTNWNTAYTYSQVGHLPLAGGNMTGQLKLNQATSPNFTDGLYANGDIYVTGGVRTGTGATFIGKMFNTSGKLALQTAATRDVIIGDSVNDSIVYVDTSAQKVGINNSSPTTALEIGGKLKVTQGGTGTSNSESGVAAISGQSQGGTINALSLVNSVTGANNNGVSLAFHNASNWSPTGQITLRQEATGTNTDSRMVFQTYRSGLHDALVLDHDQNAIVFGHMYAQGGNITAGTSSIDSSVKVFHSDGTFSVQKGWGMEFARDNSYLRPNTDDARTMLFGASTLRWNQIQLHTTSLKMGAVEFLDDSRNATLGTISSGEITSSGSITSSGNVSFGNSGNISMDGSANGQVEIKGSGYQGAIALDATAMRIYHNSGSRSLVLGTDETARMTISGGGTFNFHARALENIGAITTQGVLVLKVSDQDSAHQRVDTRDETGGFSRAYWYGVSDVGATSNFRHAWYDGSSYINVTAASNTVTFGGALAANTLTTTGGIDTNNRIKIDAGHTTARLEVKYEFSGSNHANNADVLIWASEPGITYNGGGFGVNIHESGQYYGRADDNKNYGAYMRMTPSNGHTEFWNTTASRGTTAGQGTRRVSIEADGKLSLHTGGLTSGQQIQSTRTAESAAAFWANSSHAYVQVGTDGGGASGAFGAHRETTGGSLDYTTYIGYDCYYDDVDRKWYANRTNLGRKWKTNFGGYHQNRFTISTYDGGGTSGSSLSAGWLEADWDERFGVDAQGIVDIAHSLRIGTQTVIDSSRNIISPKLMVAGDAYEGSIVFGTSNDWHTGIRQHDDGHAEMRIWHKNTNGRIYIATGYDGEPSSISKPTDGLLVRGNRLGIGNFSSTLPDRKLHVKTTDDVQIKVDGDTSQWAGIEWRDANGSNYEWFNGSTSTWSFGGGGSSSNAEKRIHAHGGVSIGAGLQNITVPTNGLSVEGDVNFLGTVNAESISAGGVYNYDSSAHLRVTHPAGAAYKINSSTITGAIKIVLPVSWTSTMMRMTIKVYEYAMGESFTIDCGGYNYMSSSSWINTFAYITGQGGTDRNFTVRFGHDGTKCCIYIGELNSTWSYPQLSVTDFQAGFSGTSASNWRSGWDIAFESSAFGTVTKTHTETDNQRYHRDITINGGNLSLRNNVNGDGTTIRDIEFLTTAAPSTDDRSVIIRASNQFGGSSNRGGKLQLLTRKTDGNFATTTIDSTGALTVQGLATLETGLQTNNSQLRVKISPWVGTTYGIGMKSGMTFGGLNNYAMTFQMDATADRGWWWGTSSHTDAQGAMALTNAGKLSVASNTRIGMGSTDTVAPSGAMLEVGGGVTVHAGAVWSATTQGTTGGSIHLDPASVTTHAGGSITWGASDTSNGTTAQAGIYVRSDSSYGTRMYLSTTDSYASGSKTALYINTNGDISVTRGSLVATGNVTAYSDIKLKRDIKEIPDALAIVQKIRGVTYERKDKDDGLRHCGVIAQEVEAAGLTEVVRYDEENDVKTVDYGNMVALCIEAIKEQQTQIETLKDIIKEMKNGNN